MINFPKTTEVNKRIQKKVFYENMNITPDIKKLFVEQVETIYWSNKIASSTSNISEGDSVTEIEVFSITLKQKDIDEKLLRQIDRAIPYHLLYILEFEEQYQAWICYKELSGSKNTGYTVNSYYHTKWVDEDHLTLKMEGLSTDAVYESFVRQIAGEYITQSSGDLKEDINISIKKLKVKKEIARLEKLARAEKQPKKKFELVQQINNIMESIKDEQ